MFSFSTITAKTKRNVPSFKLTQAKIYSRILELKGNKHPNLCQIVEVYYETFDRIFIIQERFSQSTELSVTNVFQIIKALVYLASFGVVHGSLSPDSIQVNGVFSCI